MKRSEHRILTTHVGSLIRPKALLDAARTATRARDAHDAGARGSAVADVVARQAKAGIDVVNDGEFGKSGWANYSLERLSGFEPRPDKLYPAVWLGRDRIRFAEFMAAEFPRGDDRHARARLRRADHLSAATPASAAISTTSRPRPSRPHPSRRHSSRRWRRRASATTPPTSTMRTSATTCSPSPAAMREEYLEIHKAGFVLQVDDAVLANMYDHLVAESPQRYREWAELRIDALNHALEGIPEDRIRYHICFGSWHVPHVADARARGHRRSDPAR